ncbi:hypothetical protein CR513_19078, partial [Mucuna pruriens]
MWWWILSQGGASKAQFVKKLHEKARLYMEKKGEKYAKNANKGRKEVLFKKGDLVWVHLRKESIQSSNLRSNSLQEEEDDAYMGDHT